jgi:hypothetical protein
MPRKWHACTGLGVIVASPLAAVVALAETPVSLRSLATAGAPADDVVATMFLLGVIVGVLWRVAVGLGMRVVDRVRERHGDVETLQTRILDALHVEPALGQLPFTVRAHAPLLRGTPVTLEICGQVPTSTLQQTAIEVVVREAYEHVGASFGVENRIRVAPAIPHAA